MANITFITGNQGKADFLAKFLGHPVDHIKLDLDEIQSLSLREIAEHKARQAYKHVTGPVLVEDVALNFNDWGRLPGAFTKWFIDELGVEGMCRVLDNSKNRVATGEICFAYFDGKEIKFFDGEIYGHISDKPRGNGGFGWDAIFIPDGASKTLAEMDDAETEKYSLRTTTVFPQLREFFSGLDKK